jgi:hypothetical protein
MDYHTMQLPELKAHAKAHVPKIKHYYMKTRVQLISILIMDKFPAEMILEKKTLKELQAEAKAKGIPKVWSFRRHELLELLYPRKTDLKSLDTKKA